MMNRMWNRTKQLGLIWVWMMAAFSGVAGQAATVPFTESFELGLAGWEDAQNNPLTFVASGGSDGGGYASGEFTLTANPFGGGPVILRASAADDASGGAFIGNWLTDGVGMVTAMVRHDAPEDLTFFTRIATAANFPGSVFAGTQTVAANVWTRITFAISATSPLCTGEGVTCETSLANVGNLQFGTDAPESLVGNGIAYRIDIDEVSLAAIPEPGTALLLGLGLAGIAWVGRRETQP